MPCVTIPCGSACKAKFSHAAPVSNSWVTDGSTAHNGQFFLEIITMSTAAFFVQDLLKSAIKLKSLTQWLQGLSIVWWECLSSSFEQTHQFCVWNTLTRHSSWRPSIQYQKRKVVIRYRYWFCNSLWLWLRHNYYRQSNNSNFPLPTSTCFAATSWTNVVVVLRSPFLLILSFCYDLQINSIIFTLS